MHEKKENKENGFLKKPEKRRYFYEEKGVESVALYRNDNRHIIRLWKRSRK